MDSKVVKEKIEANQNLSDETKEILIEDIEAFWGLRFDHRTGRLSDWKKIKQYNEEEQREEERLQAEKLFENPNPRPVK